LYAVTELSFAIVHHQGKLQSNDVGGDGGVSSSVPHDGFVTLPFHQSIIGFHSASTTNQITSFSSVV
jgi:hypothetical protein